MECANTVDLWKATVAKAFCNIWCGMLICTDGYDKSISARSQFRHLVISEESGCFIVGHDLAEGIIKDV